MFDVQTEQKNIYYSIEVLADILSQSKATINARVKRGELDKCPKQERFQSTKWIIFLKSKRCLTVHGMKSTLSNPNENIT
uniref:hypothetical protein n=1 Tax=Vibrio cholerae TaxID=666 RepID=UPI003F589DC6